MGKRSIGPFDQRRDMSTKIDGQTQWHEERNWGKEKWRRIQLLMHSGHAGNVINKVTVDELTF